MNVISSLNREAKILVNGRFAGILSEYQIDKDEHFVFQYEKDYLIDGSPIGSCYPLTSAPFESHELPNFFENLANEGWLREVQCKQGGIDNNDTFGLLLSNGVDLIGALSIIPYIRG